MPESPPDKIGFVIYPCKPDMVLLAFLTLQMEGLHTRVHILQSKTMHNIIQSYQCTKETQACPLLKKCCPLLRSKLEGVIHMFDSSRLKWVDLLSSDRAVFAANVYTHWIKNIVWRAHFHQVGPRGDIMDHKVSWTLEISTVLFPIQTYSCFWHPVIRISIYDLNISLNLLKYFRHTAGYFLYLGEAETHKKLGKEE